VCAATRKVVIPALAKALAVSTNESAAKPGPGRTAALTKEII
jgi:hypothetical protein